MKKVLVLGIIVIALSWNAFAASGGPDIRIIDNKVSIQAEAVPLGRLLRLLDRATGMTSKVPAELANRNISVRFELDKAMRPAPPDLRELGVQVLFWSRLGAQPAPLRPITLQEC